MRNSARNAGEKESDVALNIKYSWKEEGSIHTCPCCYSKSLIAAGFILGMFLNRFSGRIPARGSRGSEKVNEVIKYIDHNYVDTVNQASLEEKAIIGMLERLDPHSVYIPAREFHARPTTRCSAASRGSGSSSGSKATRSR
ncbi:MAG: hypothetical protein MZV63_55415 [Marinilabiliales bacterium]|nr:hypothetical protein [Marinilabiliales bacterium]